QGRIARLEQYPRFAFQARLGDIRGRDMAPRLHRAHSRWTDESFQGQRLDGDAIGQEMKWRVDVGPGVDARMDRRGIIGVAAAHALALDQFERLRGHPANRLRRQCQRYIVNLHGSALRRAYYATAIRETSPRPDTAMRKEHSPRRRGALGGEGFYQKVKSELCGLRASVVQYPAIAVARSSPQMNRKVAEDDAEYANDDLPIDRFQVAQEKPRLDHGPYGIAGGDRRDDHDPAQADGGDDEQDRHGFAESRGEKWADRPAVPDQTLRARREQKID